MNTCRCITHTNTHTCRIQDLLNDGRQTQSAVHGRRGDRPQEVGGDGGLDVQTHARQWSRHSDNGQKTGGTITHSPARNVRLHTHCAVTVDTSWNTHTDQFNIHLNNCRNHRLNCLQMIYSSSWTTVQLSPSLLCSVSYCLLRTKQSLKPWNSIKGISATWWFEHTESIALLTFNEICVQLRTDSLRSRYSLCIVCVVYCVPSPPLPSLFPSSLSLAHSLRLSCSPFIFYLNLLFSHLLTVRLLCVVRCLTDSIQLAFENNLMLFALMYILGPWWLQSYKLKTKSKFGIIHFVVRYL